MAEAIELSVLAHRLAENETMTRDIHERQIRADERAAMLADGQREMKAELAAVLSEVRDMHAEQARSSETLNSWLRALAVLVPVVPLLLHLIGR